MLKIFVDVAKINKNIMINCKRKFVKKKDFPYSCFVKFDKYHQTLMSNLDLTSKEALILLWNKQDIFQVPLERIVEQCQLCNRLNVDSKALIENGGVLLLTSQLLEHRLLLFREMGVQKSEIAFVSKYYRTMALDIALFKAWGGIPKNVNVAENLLRYLHTAPSHVPPLEELSEDLSVQEYRARCLKWYVRWKLNMSMDNEEFINKLAHSMKNNSFGHTRRVFDILQYDIGLTIEEIKNYECLSNGTPDDLKKIIKKVKTFAGVSIKKLIKEKPILHSMEYDNVTGVVDLLRKHGFVEKTFHRYPQILLINKYELATKLKRLDVFPEIRALKRNKNAFRLIRYFYTVENRIKYLQYLGIKYATVRALTGAPSNFERFVRTGVDRTKWKEIGYAFEEVLKLRPEEIRPRIEKHPRWRYIDLVSMHETLSFLLKRFDPEDLHDNLQIILYPKDTIQQVLENLPELKKPLNYRPCSPKDILALCQYDIERKHHFTGDGVWKYDASPSNHLRQSGRAPETEMSDLSDCDDGDGDDNDDNDHDLSKKLPGDDLSL